MLSLPGYTSRSIYVFLCQNKDLDNYGDASALHPRYFRGVHCLRRHLDRRYVHEDNEAQSLRSKIQQRSRRIISQLMMPSKDRKKPPDRGEGRSAASAAGANCVATATQTTEHYPPNLRRSNRGRCGWKALTFLSLFVAVVAVMAGNLANRIMMETFVMEEMKLTIGEEGVSIFNAYDRDGDGHLNVIEFEPLLERLNIEDTAEVFQKF